MQHVSAPPYAPRVCLHGFVKLKKEGKRMDDVTSSHLPSPISPPSTYLDRGTCATLFVAGSAAFVSIALLTCYLHPVEILEVLVALRDEASQAHTHRHIRMVSVLVLV